MHAKLSLLVLCERMYVLDPLRLLGCVFCFATNLARLLCSAMQTEREQRTKKRTVIKRGMCKGADGRESINFCEGQNDSVVLDIGGSKMTTYLDVA